MPPRPFPRPDLPKPKRLPAGKRMTIALGVLGPNGVILGADTEETIGDTKTDALKVSTGISFGLRGGHPSAIAITGAGDSWYLDYLFEELVRHFRDHESLTVTQLESEFRTILQKFYREHIIPFRPSEPDLDLRVIIGVQRDNQTALWVSSRSTLRKSYDHEAVGMGGTEAKRILRRATGSRHTLSLAAVIACYAIQRAKESVVGCGKNTVLLYLKDNSVFNVYPDVVEKAESLFRKYEGQEYSSFMYAVGQPFSDEAKHLEKMSKWNRDLREEFKQLTSQMLEDSQ